MTISIFDLILFEIKVLFMNLVDLFAGVERGLSFADGVTLPQPQPPQEECPPTETMNKVFADVNSTDDYKNDYNGFYFQKQTSSDSCVFVLIDELENEYTLNDSTYGTYYFENNLYYFVVSWKKVIDSLGIGNYKIRKDVQISGVTQEIYSDVFYLQQFYEAIADKTIRIDCVPTGYMRHLKVNFKDTDFKDSMRIKGFFGLEKPAYESDNIVYQDDVKKLISTRQTAEYETIDTFCTYNQYKYLRDFIFMSNDVYMNDYNVSNIATDLVKVPVIFESVEPTERDKSTFIIVDMKFSNKLQNKRNTYSE